MLTKIKVKNFKKLDNIDVELGKTVVLIGPNNSGKTSALQALALWDIGLRQWNAKREGKASPEKRPGVAINRLELISIPVPNLNLLWSDLHTRTRDMAQKRTKNIRIDVVVEGVTNDKNWSCGIEFDYSGEESCICRPIRKVGFEEKPVKEAKFTEIPDEANEVRIAYLPPMSGLAAVEPKLEPGRLNVLLGEGQTAQVLRNLCFQIYEKSNLNPDWQELTDHLKKLFGIELLPPQYIKERGEIKMSYKEQSGKQFDLSSSGRGLQQTLLLLAHLYANPNTVLLLDEPDAHLEVLRQRQTYQLITDIAEKQGSQIIAASHSEIVLNEAADRDVVIAFVGKPHRIDDRGSQVLKSLKEIGFDHYYLAEETGWVLYLEGSTDLAILKAFAEILEHEEAIDALARPFAHYVQNQPNDAKKHFWGLKYAKHDLVGIAIFDRLDRSLPDDMGIECLDWKKKELENYLCMEEVLLAYAKHDLPDDLFGNAEAVNRVNAMKESIAEVGSALKTLKKLDLWSPDVKATDEFLDPLFDKYFEKLGLPNLIKKSDYHILAHLVPKDKINSEIAEKLAAIVEIAKKAKPRIH